MGFLDSFGSALGKAMGESVKSASKKVEDQQKQIDKYTDETRRLDDKTLMQKYKNETDRFKKYAYATVLKERGYGK